MPERRSVYCQRLQALIHPRTQNGRFGHWGPWNMITDSYSNMLLSLDAILSIQSSVRAMGALRHSVDSLFHTNFTYSWVIVLHWNPFNDQQESDDRVTSKTETQSWICSYLPIDQTIFQIATNHSSSDTKNHWSNHSLSTLCLTDACILLEKYRLPTVSLLPRISSRLKDSLDHYCCCCISSCILSCSVLV